MPDNLLIFLSEIYNNFKKIVEENEFVRCDDGLSEDNSSVTPPDTPDYCSCGLVTLPGKRLKNTGRQEYINGMQ